MKRTIYITGEITSALADSVQLEIDKCLAENVSEIEFRVNSPGGSVVAGLQLYDLVSGINNIKTTCYIYGLCASAATYCCLGVDESFIAPNARWMTHEPQGGLYGNIEELENDIEYFASLRNQILAIYCAKTGLDAEEIVAHWTPNWYMTAQEAVEFKFIDGIAAGLTNLADNEAETAPETLEEEKEGKDTPEESEARVDDSGESEEEVEETGAILSLKNLVRKCKEIIKRPVVDEYDEAADLKNKLDDMSAKYEALEAENKSIKEAMEANVAELQNKLAEVENERTALYNAIEEQKKNIETTVSNQVNARIAALGYDEEELAQPTNTIENVNIADIARKYGLDFALNYLNGNK